MASVPVLQPQVTPLAAYLARLAPSSQHTMRKFLDRICELLGSSLSAADFPWARLRYRDTFRLRQQLGQRFGPRPRTSRSPPSAVSCAKPGA